jgi:hypothetical protein
MPAPREPSQRTRMWRRRALLRKGARLYSTMDASSDLVSLAMLDEDGVVVAWHERARDADLGESSVVDQHVSQLYVAEDVARGMPARDLCNAALHGNDMQRGWRRAPDGSTFWAMTVIEPLMLRDGRLQGFSYVTRRRSAPWKKEKRTDACAVKTGGIATEVALR